MQVGILAHSGSQGDALGRYLVHKLAFFRERAADLRLFVETAECLHPDLTPFTRTCPGGRIDPENWRFLAEADLVIAEYDRPFALLHQLPRLAGGRPRLLMDYQETGLSGPGAAIPEHHGLFWCADAVLVHSRFALDEVRQATGYPHERLSQLALPLDETGDSAETAAGPLALRLGTEGARLLLGTGPRTSDRCLAIVGEALAQLRRQRPPVQADVIGPVDGPAIRCGDPSADLLLVPAPGQGAGQRIRQATARGLPVVAARAADLPEAVGAAGLTFRPDDAEDLARQLGRLLTTIERPPPARALRIAVVSLRYGKGFAGGAEASLRAIAEALHRRGQDVAVYSTCTLSACDWQNVLPEGTTRLAGVPVHRFAVDPYDRKRHLESVQRLLDCKGPPPAAVEEEYLRHSVRSSRLVRTLGRQMPGLDAVIVGPYLFGLTFAVAQAFPEKTLLLPCFHDEPLARLRAWQAYARVAGMLFHSPEEREFTERVLGLNHPHAVEVGAYLGPLKEHARPASASARPCAGRYLVYCGRYTEEKGVPRLLEYARDYQRVHPGRFSFVFMGQGGVRIPRAAWVQDLGFVSEERKQEVLASADALVQLSRNESLSLVALEAWAAGVPVLVDQECAVLKGQVGRSGGGAAVRDFDGFSRALDDLWENPGAWRHKGQRGREYVAGRYGSEEAYGERLLQALAALRTPLRELARQQGLRRAAACHPGAWRADFSALVEDLLHKGPRPYREQLQVRPQQTTCSASPAMGDILLPVRVVNNGTHAVAAQGPGRFVLRAHAVGPDGLAAAPLGATALPRLLPPGKALAAVVAVPVPAQPGVYRIQVWAERVDRDNATGARGEGEGACELVVAAEGPVGQLVCSRALELVQAQLAEAAPRRRLPQDYADVTQGWFARGKRWLKQKLLNNFKRGYVDVLSAQQSAVNASLLTTIGELAECCATLDHAVHLLQERLRRLEAGESSAALDRPDHAAEWRPACARSEHA